MEEKKAGGLTKFFYSFGSIAFGVKDNGFTTFLMIYYNQVLGLSAFYTGLAILIALVVDAISDPYVGHLSDNWQSKLGRRHPFMYAAILPIMLSYYFLWNLPGDMTQFALFVYLTTLAVTVRLLITFFEVPNSAMVAELTRGYDARTTLTSMRVTIAWLGGVVVAVMAYVFYLVPTEKYGIGVLNLEGYQNFAILAVAVMGITMLISAGTTHRLIPFLPSPPVHTNKVPKRSYWHNLKTVWENASFRSLFLGSLFSMMAFGVIITLQIYYATFFFGLTTQQIAYFPMVMVLAALLSLAITPILARGYEKKTVLKFTAIACLLLSNITIILRLLDWLPENGDPLLLPVMLLHILVSTAAMVAQQSIFVSMTADLVEDTERVIGYRIEGLYFAAISFSRKVVSGLGIFASGIFLSSASDTGETLTEAVMTEVSYLYVPFVTFLYIATWYYANRYTLSRKDHEENLSALSKSPVAGE